MNKSISLSFELDGSVRILDEAVEGARLVIQSALVNLLTPRNMDELYPDRGTGILDAALAGLISGFQSAQHEANFAASDVLYFSRAHETADTADKLEQVLFTPSQLTLGALDMQAAFRMIDGRNFSYRVQTLAET